MTKQYLYQKYKKSIQKDVLSKTQLINHAILRSQMRQLDSHVGTVSEKKTITQNDIIKDCQLVEQQNTSVLTKIQQSRRKYLIMDIEQTIRQPLNQSQFLRQISRDKSLKVYRYANTPHKQSNKPSIPIISFPVKTKKLNLTNPSTRNTKINLTVKSSSNTSLNLQKPKSKKSINKINLFSMFDHTVNSFLFPKSQKNQQMSIISNQIVASIPKKTKSFISINTSNQIQTH